MKIKPDLFSNLNFNRIFIMIIFLLSILIRVNVESKSQYVQPLMMGMQVAIPWDIANIWNRPVSFSPFLSTFLGVSLLYIIFFGVITTPFGYFFGVPSQKYVMGTSGPESLITNLLNNAELWRNYTLAKEAEEAAAAMNSVNSDQPESLPESDPSSFSIPTPSSSNQGSDIPRSFSDNFAKPLLRKILNYQWESPDFTDRIFRFIPSEILDENTCQQLLLCHAHSAFQSLPQVYTPAYRVFSKSLTNIPRHHRKAIKAGLNGLDCSMEFQECPFDIHSLFLRILLGGLPSWLRRALIMPQM